MARTLYAQILKEWYWDKISAAMDEAAAAHRENITDKSDGNTPPDEFVTEGKFNDISLWAGNENDGPDGFSVRLYIGSVMNIYPSGKYYMPWSTNVTEAEAAKDEAFGNAFEKAAAKFNIYLQSGEGDPTDLFLVRYYEWE